MKNTLIFLLLILPTINLCAQVLITGKVIDSKGSIIPNVNIVPRGSSPSLSGAGGEFEILCPKDSNSILTHFSSIGYKTKTTKLYRGEKDIQILLLDSIQYLSEVTVRSPKYSRFSNYAAQTIKMNSFEIYTNPHALGDIFGSLQILPGVQRNVGRNLGMPCPESCN
jgi:hypothetical protein